MNIATDGGGGAAPVAGKSPEELAAEQQAEVNRMLAAQAASTPASAPAPTPDYSGRSSGFQWDVDQATSDAIKQGVAPAPAPVSDWKADDRQRGAYVPTSQFEATAQRGRDNYGLTQTYTPPNMVDDAMASKLADTYGGRPGDYTGLTTSQLADKIPGGYKPTDFQGVLDNRAVPEDMTPSKASNPWQSITPWKEDKGQTFGAAATDTFREAVTMGKIQSGTYNRDSIDKDYRDLVSQQSMEWQINETVGKTEYLKKAGDDYDAAAAQAAKDGQFITVSRDDYLAQSKADYDAWLKANKPPAGGAKIMGASGLEHTFSSAQEYRDYTRAQQPSTGSLAKEFGIGLVPIAGTIHNWNNMGTGGKALSILGDALFVVPLVGWVGGAAVKGGVAVERGISMGSRIGNVATSTTRLTVDTVKGIGSAAKGFVTAPINLVRSPGTVVSGVKNAAGGYVGAFKAGLNPENWKGIGGVMTGGRVYDPKAVAGALSGSSTTRFAVDKQGNIATPKYDTGSLPERKLVGFKDMENGGNFVGVKTPEGRTIGKDYAKTVPNDYELKNQFGMNDRYVPQYARETKPVAVSQSPQSIATENRINQRVATNQGQLVADLKNAQATGTLQASRSVDPLSRPMEVGGGRISNNTRQNVIANNKQLRAQLRELGRTEPRQNTRIEPVPSGTFQQTQSIKRAAGLSPDTRYYIGENKTNVVVKDIPAPAPVTHTMEMPSVKTTPAMPVNMRLPVSGMTAVGIATPTPIPVPTPTPAPRPAPMPMPQPSPAPAPIPSPVPSPIPSPVPSPVPAPRPIPSPVPAPVPTPAPLPVPLPTPVPRPQPEPAPAPTPIPTPIPVPVSAEMGIPVTRPPTLPIGILPGSIKGGSGFGGGAGGSRVGNVGQWQMKGMFIGVTNPNTGKVITGGVQGRKSFRYGNKENKDLPNYRVAGGGSTGSPGGRVNKSINIF